MTEVIRVFRVSIINSFNEDLNTINEFCTLKGAKRFCCLNYMKELIDKNDFGCKSNMIIQKIIVENSEVYVSENEITINIHDIYESGNYVSEFEKFYKDYCKYNSKNIKFKN